MNLSQEQASSALHDLARAQRRLGVFSGYERAAPHLWLRGVIWIVGFSVTDLAPRYAGWVSLVLDVGGVACGVAIVRCQAGAAWGDDTEWMPRRMVVIALAIGLLIFASYDLMRPQGLAQYGAFPVLLMDLLYTLAGLFASLRWLVTGLVLRC